MLLKKDRITFSEILILIVGCILMAISLNLFFNPHAIAAGGITGLGVVLNSLFGVEQFTFKCSIIHICLQNTFKKRLF